MKKNSIEAIVASQASAAIAEVKNSKKNSTKGSKVTNSKKETPATEAKEEETPKVELKKITKKTSTKKAPKISAKETAIEEAKEQQKPALIEAVVSNREVKWLYPEDITDTVARKSWRQKQRNKLHKLERDMLRIADVNSKERKAAERAYNEFAKTVLKAGASA